MFFYVNKVVTILETPLLQNHQKKTDSLKSCFYKWTNTPKLFPNSIAACFLSPGHHYMIFFKITIQRLMNLFQKCIIKSVQLTSRYDIMMYHKRATQLGPYQQLIHTHTQFSVMMLSLRIKNEAVLS